MDICYYMFCSANEPFAQVSDSPTAARVNGNWLTNIAGYGTYYQEVYP